MRCIRCSPICPEVLHLFPLFRFPPSHCSDPTRSPSPQTNQILVQKWFSLKTNCLCILVINMFLFAPEGITFGPDRFWSKVFNISLHLSKSIRPYKPKDQIDNKLFHALKNLTFQFTAVTHMVYLEIRLHYLDFAIEKLTSSNWISKYTMCVTAVNWKVKFLSACIYLVSTSIFRGGDKGKSKWKNDKTHKSINAFKNYEIIWCALRKFE